MTACAQWAPRLVRAETRIRGRRIVVVRYRGGDCEIYAVEPGGLEMFAGYARRGSSFDLWCRRLLERKGRVTP